MARYFKIILIALVSTVLGCSSNDSLKKQDYFPLEIDKSISYSVEEKNYTLTGGGKTSQYYIKETIGEQIGTVTEQPVYALIRHKRTRPEDTWSLDSLWSIYKQSDKVVKVENNVSYIKLALPLKAGITWNGNALNMLPALNYTTKTHPEGMEIIHYNDSSAVELNRSREIYAPDKGMIYKEVIHYKYCQSTPDCIGKGIVASGKSIVYKAQ
jgi:hypothetical protein